MTERAQRKVKNLASSRRLCSELAILATLLIHLALFYSFKMLPPSESQKVSAPEPDCILLSPLAETNKALWEKNLLAWYFLADPTLITLPDDQLGFGVVRNGERIIPLRHTPRFEYTVKLSEEKGQPNFALARHLAPVEPEISDKWSAAGPRMPEAPTVTPLPAGIVWRFPDGMRLPDAPQLDSDKIKTAIQTAKPPLRPTLIEVNQEATFTRVRIRQPSGNLLLDQLAVKQLKQEISRIKRRNHYQQKTETRSYLPKKGQTRCFEVEWRLLESLVQKDKT